MNKRFIIFSVGKLLEILALVLLVPAGIAFFEIPAKSFPSVFCDPRLLGFLIAIVSSFVIGNLLKLLGNRELTGTGIREGFAIVTFGWVFLTLVGAIPLYVYFISQADPIPTWDMIDAILAAAGLPPVKGTISYQTAWTIGAIMEFFYRIFKLPGEPPMTRFLADAVAKSHWFDISAAKTDLGYAPAVPLEEGLLRLEDWLKTSDLIGVEK